MTSAGDPEGRRDAAGASDPDPAQQPPSPFPENGSAVPSPESDPLTTPADDLPPVGDEADVEPTPAQVDALFQEIVAHFDWPAAAPRTPPVEHGPDPPGVLPEPDQATSPAESHGPSTAPADRTQPPQPPGWRVHQPPESELDEHFEPPPPAPLPVYDLGFWGILVGLGIAPVLLVLLVILDRYGDPLWKWVAAALIVMGAVLLVRRLPRHGERDDDDGARV